MDHNDTFDFDFYMAELDAGPDQLDGDQNNDDHLDDDGDGDDDHNHFYDRYNENNGNNETNDNNDNNVNEQNAENFDNDENNENNDDDKNDTHDNFFDDEYYQENDYNSQQTEPNTEGLSPYYQYSHVVFSTEAAFGLAPLDHAAHHGHAAQHGRRGVHLPPATPQAAAGRSSVSYTPSSFSLPTPAIMPHGRDASQAGYAGDLAPYGQHRGCHPQYSTYVSSNAAAAAAPRDLYADARYSGLVNESTIASSCPSSYLSPSSYQVPSSYAETAASTPRSLSVDVSLGHASDLLLNMGYNPPPPAKMPPSMQGSARGKVGKKPSKSRTNPTRSENRVPCLLHSLGCTKYFRSKNERKRHFKTQHLACDSYVCVVCPSGGTGTDEPKVILRSDNAQQHFLRMHTDGEILPVEFKPPTSSAKKAGLSIEPLPELPQHVLDTLEVLRARSRVDAAAANLCDVTCAACPNRLTSLDAWVEHMSGHASRGGAGTEWLTADARLVQRLLDGGAIIRAADGGLHLPGRDGN